MYTHIKAPPRSMSPSSRTAFPYKSPPLQSRGRPSIPKSPSLRLSSKSPPHLLVKQSSMKGKLSEKDSERAVDYMFAGSSPKTSKRTSIGTNYIERISGTQVSTNKVSTNTPHTSHTPALMSPTQNEILELETRKARAIANEDFAEAQRIKLMIDVLKKGPSNNFNTSPYSGIVTPPHPNHQSPPRSTMLISQESLCILAEPTFTRQYGLNSNPSQSVVYTSTTEIVLKSTVDHELTGVYLRTHPNDNWQVIGIKDIAWVAIGPYESRTFSMAGQQIADAGKCLSISLSDNRTIDLEFSDEIWMQHFLITVSTLSTQVFFFYIFLFFFVCTRS